MVQVIQPGITGSQLVGESLGQGFNQSLSQMLEQHHQQQQRTSALSGLAPFLEQSGLEPQQIQQVIQSGIDPAILAGIVKSSGISKHQQAEETKRIGQTSFNRMGELLKEGKLGLGSKVKGAVFGGKTAEDVGEFESLTGAIEAMLVDRVNRGTLSNSRFNYITKTLIPRPNDRQATIKGKLKALARELDLDPAALGLQKEVEKGTTVTVKLPDGRSTQVSKDKLDEIRKRSMKHFGKDIEVVE